MLSGRNACVVSLGFKPLDAVTTCLIGGQRYRFPVRWRAALSEALSVGMRSFTAPLVALLVVVSFPCVAREIVSMGDDFGVLRDFSDISIASSEAKRTDVFFDAEKFAARGVSADDAEEMRRLAVSHIDSKFHLVNRKDVAALSILVQSGNYTNYAIRNRRGMPSLGYVVFSVCRLPVKSIPTDCENLQYESFRKQIDPAVFSEVLQMWLSRFIRPAH